MTLPPHAAKPVPSNPHAYMNDEGGREGAPLHPGLGRGLGLGLGLGELLPTYRHPNSDRQPNSAYITALTHA